MLNNCHEPDAVREDLPPDLPTFGEMLAGAGYDNSYLGKWHVGRTQRPEDVYQRDADRLPAWTSRSIPTVVDVTEPMGDEIFVYLRFADDETPAEGTGDPEDQLLMSIEPDAAIEREAVDVVLDLSKVHIFDGESGEALVHGIDDLVDDRSATGSTESDA